MTESKVSAPSEEKNLTDWGAIWKDMYFRTESSFSEAWKDFLGTDAFVNALNKTMADYLATNRMARQQFEAMNKLTNYASRQDVARVAELILSLEEKNDILEEMFTEKMDMLADNLMKMTEIFKKLEQQNLAMATEIKDIIEDALAKLENPKPAAKTTTTRTTTTRKTPTKG